MKRSIVLSTLVLVFPLAARADLSLVATDPIAGDSFQTGLAFGCGAPGCDLVGFRINSGGPFEFPALTDFNTDDWAPPVGTGSATAVGWSEIYNDGTFAYASGPAEDSVYTILNWAGTDGDPYNYSVVLFEVGEDTLALSVNFFFDGESGGQGAGTWFPTRTEIDGQIIPIPGAVWLGALGLGMVGWVKRKDA